ncbi:MAG: L,D-transpeptidase [Myxococcota bacterium]
MAAKTRQPARKKPEPKGRAQKSGRSHGAQQSSLGGPIAAVSALLFVAAGSVWAWSCSKDPAPPSPAPTGSAQRVQMVPPGVEPGAPETEKEAVQDAGVSDATAGLDPDAPWEGPWIGAKVMTAPVYSAMYRTRENLIGYLRYGSKAPAADATPLQKKNCKDGWYRLHPYGYICGRHGTPNLDDPHFKAGTTPPDLESTVPYKYAHNNRNGTPLYRRIPTREQMEQYEPDRRRSEKKSASKSKKSKTAKSKRRKGDAAASAPVLTARAAGSSAPASSALPRPVLADAGLDLPPLPPLPPAITEALDAGTSPLAEADGGPVDAGEDAKPWWMRPDAGEDEITLADMTADSDDILAKRMARGFFIAVDKSFRKNGRYWHKTTEGLLAPSDKMYINSPPKFQGVELVGEDAPSLPVGWSRVQAAKYELDGKKLKRKGHVDRFEMVPMTGKTMKHGKRLYREAKAGFWVRASQFRVTDPGPPPADLKPGERWIDVDIDSQTLVAFEGDKPVYATMISSGKKGRTRKTDHSTVLGAFRVREKHVAATMDGDGAAPGEGPYSIQDVPYVLYFERSYAIHGAFWHNNFGTRMSHGCVNLAPLDAKRIFFWSEPRIPRGWHGMWSTPDRPGSYVVVHD